MKVQDIMSSDVSSVSKMTNVADIAKIMKERNIGAVPVVDNDSLVGIITDRDIVLRVVAENKNLSQSTAEHVMTSDPVFIDYNSDIDQAVELMSEYQVKRLPVIRNGKLTGMLALGDLAIEQIHMDEAGEALSGISRGITH